MITIAMSAHSRETTQPLTSLLGLDTEPPKTDLNPTLTHCHSWSIILSKINLPELGFSRIAPSMTSMRSLMATGGDAQRRLIPTSSRVKGDECRTRRRLSRVC